MKIVSVTSAFPKHYYSQETLFAALQQYWGNGIPRIDVLRRLHKNVGVEGRFLSLPIDEYPRLRSWGEANDHWIRTAQELGHCAITCAVNKAGLQVQDIGAFFFTSVTGICSPSIDARLINRMGMSPNIRRVPMFGLGCVAGAAGISQAADYVRAHPDQTALLLAVELCSLTLQREDFSVANLISTGLFGDGAAAVLIAGDQFSLPATNPQTNPGPEILATRSIFYPGTEDMMGWHVSEDGFRIVLSPEVPDLIEQHLGHDVDGFLADLGYDRSHIQSWVLHPGGPKVLQATVAALGLENTQVSASWDCLRRVGNLSSASVLVVLEEVINKRRPAPGSLGLLAAMGPGFCSELVALEW
ncbi:MAG: type III polyketide synthase [Terriglobales bacterium]